MSPSAVVSPGVSGVLSTFFKSVVVVEEVDFIAVKTPVVSI